MIKLLTIIGARPQIIKAAAISRAIRTHYSDKIREVILHTGQHYDENMSAVFIDQLGVPEPDYNLQVGSSTHGKQTAAMIQGIEDILLKEEPDGLIVYGDTNSTLAGAIAASKLHIPVFHIEAGLRSFNKSMPEEINRILCDHVSTLLFTPTKAGLKNLENEGFAVNAAGNHSIDRPGVYHCGDIMYDNSLHFSEVAGERSEILELYGLNAGNYILSTIHRNNNTDQPKRLTDIFSALLNIADANDVTIVLPLHPRTGKLLEKNLPADIYANVTKNERIKLIPPASFLDIIQLEKNAKMVITDSGGVQKEAFFFQKPCIVLRPETEWVELVEIGNSILADASKEKIISAYNALGDHSLSSYPPIFGDGKASEFICEKILENIPGK